jgi:hypothetical protein
VPSALYPGVGLLNQLLATGLQVQFELVETLPPYDQQRPGTVLGTPYASKRALKAGLHSIDRPLRGCHLPLVAHKLPPYRDHMLVPTLMTKG